MVAWPQRSLKCPGGRWLPVISLSMGQSDQVPASSLALVSYWQEQT